MRRMSHIEVRRCQRGPTSERFGWSTVASPSNTLGSVRSSARSTVCSTVCSTMVRRESATSAPPPGFHRCRSHVRVVRGVHPDRRRPDRRDSAALPRRRDRRRGSRSRGIQGMAGRAGATPRRTGAPVRRGTARVEARPRANWSRSNPARSCQEGLGEVQEMIDICDFAVGLSRQLYGLTIASERPRPSRCAKHGIRLGVVRHHHRVQLPGGGRGLGTRRWRSSAAIR